MITSLQWKNETMLSFKQLVSQEGCVKMNSMVFRSTCVCSDGKIQNVSGYKNDMAVRNPDANEDMIEL